MRTTRTALVTFLAAIAALAAVAPPAGAAPQAVAQQQPNRPFLEIKVADLAPVPHSPEADGGSAVSGKTAFIRIFDRIVVLEFVNGASAGLPHAQHVHGVGAGVCPSADRAGEDGLISTADGIADYGSVQTSLTTRGDTSAMSALAVDRFPVANPGNFFLYGRTLRIGTDIPAEVGYDLDNFHVVVHGIDINGNGAYDFDAGVSSLDPSLPLEATVPAACGEIR